MGIALITGGTSGIGASFAQELASRGHDLVLVARGHERLERTAAQLRAYGVTVEILAADLCDRADVTRVRSRLEDSENPIDILVNNAGFGIRTALTDADLTEHERGIEVMCRTVLVLAGAAARGMRERGSGTIINVSSAAGFLAMGGYSAIKAWVTSFSESLAVELKDTGVHVTAVCPGWVRTEFHHRAGITASSIPNAMWLNADTLVKAAMRDVDKRRVISVPTVRYRFLIGLVRLAPRSAVRAISGAVTSSRRRAAAT